MPDQRTAPAGIGNDIGDARLSAFAVPDVFLGAAHLSAAQAVLDRVIGTENIRLAFVGGSLAAGLGHGLSDIDVYVSLNQGVPAALNYQESGFMVQVNPLSAAQVEHISAVCADYRDTALDRRQTDLADEELAVPLRYAIGTVIIDKCGTLPPAPDSRRTIRRILMNRHAYGLSGLAEDALGALAVQDRLTALQASLMCVEHALECALAGAGDVYLGRKFLLRRSARVPAMRTVLDDAWACLRQPAAPGTLGAVREIAVRRTLFSSHLVACCLLDGWDEPIGQIPSFRDLRRDGGPLRSPWVTPVRFADSFGMAGPITGFQTTAAMVRLWHCLNGQPVSAVHQELASAAVQVSRDGLDSAISQLIEVKAAVSDSGSVG